MDKSRSRIWMSMMLLLGIATVGLGMPAGAAPGAPASPQGVGDASCFAPGPHGFTDVPADRYYNTAVAWLVEAGITGGTSPGKYSPNNPVTRAQMAVFLWHLKGDPTPAGPHNFTDVPTNSYYNTAVSWLVGAGITGGTSPGKYSPNNPVTRAQMAVFLWHYDGDPTPTGPHNFTDVPTTSYYNTAVAWLVGAGITGGTSPGTYSPNNPVTRAQMAVFLWKYSCPPPSPSLTLATGQNHTCALKPDATVKCWGSNEFGQMGGGTAGGKRPSPTPVEGLTDITAITAGFAHTCALTTNRTVTCWGYNGSGQIGDGTTNNARLTPTPVPGLGNVTAITAGSDHTCAVTSDRTVKCWGANSAGQVGDGTTSPRLTPTPVVALTNVTAITAGSDHTCATTRYSFLSTVKCWGNNEQGQLGDGTTTRRLTPTEITGLTNVTATITSGGGHTCATTTSGTATCWGSNYWGELGDGTTGTNRLTPTAVTGLTNTATITAGGGHTCATTTSGTTKCWGYNGHGQVGDGTTTQRPTPTAVTGLTNAATITAGTIHTCATTTSGTATCWGRNEYGQVGDGTTGTNRLTPTPVAGL